MMNRPHKLFISHSSKDADYVEAIVGLLEILGLRDEEIICSSVPPYCIPLGNKIYDWLVNEFQQSDIHVVYTFSEDYYASAASLNEMGATWAMKHKWTGLLLPGFSFDELDGCIDKTQISIKLDDADTRTLKYRLSEFKDEIIKEFNLRPMSEATWERYRDEFLYKIVDIKDKRTRAHKEKSVTVQQYIPEQQKTKVMELYVSNCLTKGEKEKIYSNRTETINLTNAIDVADIISENKTAIFEVSTKFSFSTIYNSEDGERKRFIEVSGKIDNILIVGNTSVKNWVSKSYQNNIVQEGEYECTVWFTVIGHNSECYRVQYLIIGGTITWM